KNINMQLAVGGNGGSGNHGGVVTVTNRAAIVTSGKSSDGIRAQSLGGGGGDGGNALFGSAGLLPQPYEIDPTLILVPIEGTPLTRNLVVTVGGSGGASGDGKTVAVTNEGAIH